MLQRNVLAGRTIPYFITRQHAARCRMPAAPAYRAGRQWLATRYMPLTAAAFNACAPYTLRVLMRGWGFLLAPPSAATAYRCTLLLSSASPSPALRAITRLAVLCGCNSSSPGFTISWFYWRTVPLPYSGCHFLAGLYTVVDEACRPISTSDVIGNGVAWLLL